PASKHATTTAVRISLSLHDALPISGAARIWKRSLTWASRIRCVPFRLISETPRGNGYMRPKQSKYSFPTMGSASLLFTRMKISRSEEHTSELQSRENLVCRLLLEKK